MPTDSVQVECEFCGKTFLAKNFDDITDLNAGISCKKCFDKQFGTDGIKAKNGFRGNIFSPTPFTVGEKGMKEHVTRKKSNNIFDMGGF